LAYLSSFFYTIVTTEVLYYTINDTHNLSALSKDPIDLVNLYCPPGTVLSTWFRSKVSSSQ